MGILSNILGKLGIGNANAAPATKPNPSSTTINKPNPSATTTAKPGPSSAAPPQRPAGASTPQAAPPPDKSVPVVDVVAQLEKRAAENPQKLNWRTSIVDLLKLLDIDSSLESRKELAKELKCPPEFMEDSAKMNGWLHKTVLARIAANGGNVPKDLMD